MKQGIENPFSLFPPVFLELRLESLGNRGFSVSCAAGETAD